VVDGLTDQEAYRIEKQKIEELHKQNRGQLWNTIDERFIGITWKEYKQKRRFSLAKGLTSSPSVSAPYRISKVVGRETSLNWIVRRNAATYVTRKRGLL
jgi:ligand-binding sensor domain-containing protein